jgi:hypothetical protein
MTDETLTEEVPHQEGDAEVVVSEEDQQAFYLARLQEQAEADQEELKRLRIRCVTLRKVVNDQAQELSDLKQKLGQPQDHRPKKADKKKKGK